MGRKCGQSMQLMLSGLNANMWSKLVLLHSWNHKSISWNKNLMYNQPNDHQSKKQTIKSKLDDLNLSWQKKLLVAYSKLNRNNSCLKYLSSTTTYLQRKLPSNVEWNKLLQIEMMQQQAINYRECQKMPLLCHHGLLVSWQQCSKIGNMLSYCGSEHYQDFTSLHQ